VRIPEDRPNIILINADDLGYGDLGCYGSERNSTPVLDGMAEQGLRLSDFYMAAPVCTPSRAAMLTGCYAQRVDMQSSDKDAWVLFPGDAKGLNPEETTLGSALKARGYATQLVGKWHLGDQPDVLPTRHGFDDYYGLPYSNDMGRQTGREHYPPLPLLDGDAVIQQQPDQASLTERYVERAVRFMREHRDEPFFIYFAHMYVHLPLYAPKRFLDQSRNGSYGAAVECIDWATGVLMHELKQLSLDRNTLVIFTSDNGSRAREEGGSNLPLRGRKGQTYEGGMRVPGIFHWPGVIAPGESSQLCTAMDLLPTLAKLTGASLSNRQIDGEDISPLLLGQRDADRPRTLCFFLQQRFEAVRHGDWKLHLERRELYNLANDIAEAHNVIDGHPDVVAELDAIADNYRRQLGDSITGVEGNAVRKARYVSDPKPLTEYDANHPYIMAMYDMEDAG